MNTNVRVFPNLEAAVSISSDQVNGRFFQVDFTPAAVVGKDTYQIIMFDNGEPDYRTPIFIKSFEPGENHVCDVSAAELATRMQAGNALLDSLITADTAQ